MKLQSRFADRTHFSPHNRLSWLRVDQWSTRGGSELGTNRHLPNEDLAGIAAKLEEYKIDALLIVGGFEGMISLSQLEKGRKEFPKLKIPLVHLPATISNNVVSFALVSGPGGTKKIF